jgi:hypothetical protein
MVEVVDLVDIDPALPRLEGGMRVGPSDPESSSLDRPGSTVTQQPDHSGETNAVRVLDLRRSINWRRFA